MSWFLTKALECNRVAISKIVCHMKSVAYCQANNHLRTMVACANRLSDNPSLNACELKPGLLNNEVVLNQRSRLVHVTCVRYAGHSHWHNIRHIKESKDATKQRTASDIARRLKVAVREGGSVNPKLNSALQRVLEDGKARDVPAATMMEVLKRLEKGKDVKGTQLFVEAKGIGNCMIVVETYTAKPKWMRQEVQRIMKYFGGSIGEVGAATHCFNFKGIVYLPKEKDTVLSEDQAFEVAIEVGAEEVTQGLDDGNLEVYQFICDPKQLHAVKKALEDRGFTPVAARLEYIPHTFVKLDETGLEIASKMLDGLETLEDVIRVYDNIES